MLEIFQRTNLTFGPVLTTFLLGFVTFLLLLWYSYRKQSYWKKLGVPYVPPMPFLGSSSILYARKKTFQDIEMERVRKYGRIYGHYESNRPLLSIAEPDLLRQVLVKDFQTFNGGRVFDAGHKVAQKMLSFIRGKDWKRIRTIISPTFSTGKIKRMLGIFKECAHTVVKNFKKSADKGEPVDVKSIYGAFTMDVIASSAFSTKIDSHNDPNNPFVQSAKKIFSGKINWKFFVILMLPFLQKLFKFSFFSRKAMDFFTNVTLQIIEERKRTGQTRNDFLQLLLDTAKELSEDGSIDSTEKDDIAENYDDESSQVLNRNVYTKKTLTHDKLIAQCVTFFLAGYETTASLLTFASYNLALNPDIQEKLIKKVDDSLRDNNGKLDYETLQNMKYLDNVISETLRIFSPIVRLERMADENYKLGDTGLTIPKGMIVTIPVYAIHRDPELYPEPEKFDPDRFTPEERAKRKPCAYLPFGAGPRNCVAMRFALFEVKVCLVHVLCHFRIKKCAQTKVPPDFYFGQGLVQPKNIKLLFEPRTDEIKEL